jgi:hypothetical protein
MTVDADPGATSGIMLPTTARGMLASSRVDPETHVASTACTQAVNIPHQVQQVLGPGPDYRILSITKLNIKISDLSVSVSRAAHYHRQQREGSQEGKNLGIMRPARD